MDIDSQIRGFNPHGLVDNTEGEVSNVDVFDLSLELTLTEEKVNNLTIGPNAVSLTARCSMTCRGLCK